MKWHGHWQFWQWWHWQPPTPKHLHLVMQESRSEITAPNQWWSSPPPVALQCCRLPDKGLDPPIFDLHHLLHHHLCSSLFWYWKGQGSSSANLQKKNNCNMSKMALKGNYAWQQKNGTEWDDRNLWGCEIAHLRDRSLHKNFWIT